jgi:N-acetylglucosamine-6-phosphate deacetylase
MIVLAGGDIVLPDRVIASGALLIDGDRIVAIDDRSSIRPAGARVIDTAGKYIVPGFIDVHVHGVEGVDTLDGGDAVAEIAARLPRYGVTAFCPTTVACDPTALAAFLDQVGRCRRERAAPSARVLPAHLESNFINPEYCGAQPVACLRAPVAAATGTEVSAFAAADILSAIAAARRDVGIVTVAPELDAGIELVRRLVSAGHRVSLGHSGADFDTAIAAIEAGARQATHLFNRMPPMTHRAPGLVGAILSRADVAAELICDMHHVHPAMCQMAIAAKSPRRVMVITDATAGAGLPVGSTARLGGRAIRVADAAAFLEDGTLAGSTLTMDRAFRNVVTDCQRSVVDAAHLCSTTAARELNLEGLGAIEHDAAADLVILDRRLSVTQTMIAGELVYDAGR